MKNTLFIAFILILFNFLGYAQELKNQKNTAQNHENPTSRSSYSSYNLWKASPQELNLYQKKAQGMKTTGIVMTITGPVMMISGLVLVAASWGQHGGGLSLAGLASTAIGIPLWVSGSKRKEKVNQEFQKRARLSFDVSPNLIFTNNRENLSPGLTLKIGF